MGRTALAYAVDIGGILNAVFKGCVQSSEDEPVLKLRIDGG